LLETTPNITTVGQLAMKTESGGCLKYRNFGKENRSTKIKEKLQAN